MSKFGVFCGLYFHVFGLNTEIWKVISPYLIRIQQNKEQEKLRVWILFIHSPLAASAISEEYEVSDLFILSFKGNFRP